jgi:hypothetical protein
MERILEEHLCRGFFHDLAQVHHCDLIEVPFSMPLDTVISHRLELAGLVLKTAEAIGLDMGVEMELEIVRARGIADAIVDVLEHDGYDLLLLESGKAPEKGGRQSMGSLLNEIVQKAKCRTWICNSTTTENKTSLEEIAGIKK